MSIASDLLGLFRGCDRAHGIYELPPQGTGNGKQKGTAQTLPGPPTEVLWQRHLDGGKGLGVVPLDETGHSYWSAIDVDIYPLDHVKLEAKIAQAGFPFVMCRTKSGGAHLFMFFKEPVKAKLVRRRMTEFAAHLGYPGTEVFPKQDKLDSDSGMGNWINMPYHNDVNLTSRYAIIDGRAADVETFIEHARSVAIREADLLAIVPQEIDDELADGPPCLHHLVQIGFPHGSMNNALFSMGVYAREKWEEGWELKIHDYNQRFMGPGLPSEVNQIIKSLGKKGYAYKCSDVPLAHHCNKNECYKRKYGIKKPGRKAEHDKDNLPCILDEVDRPVRVHRPVEGSGDEPQWTFRIGAKTLDVTLDMVLDQTKFLREYSKRFERVALPVKQNRWADVMNELLGEAEVEELPADAGPEGQLMLQLEAFTTGRLQARDKSELLLKKPWHDGEGKVWFRSKDFMEHLDRVHFRQFKEREMWAVFRRKGATNAKLMIKGVCVGVWGFPEFARQNEDFDAVEVITEEGEEAPF
jgi:hypothetical protein